MLMTVSVNMRQADKISLACKNLIEHKYVSIMQLAKVVGLLVASLPGVELGSIFYRRLDIAKNEALKLNKGNFEAKLLLTNDMICDLFWWINNIHTTFKPISHGNPVLIIYSDASLKGWGGGSM